MIYKKQHTNTYLSTILHMSTCELGVCMEEEMGEHETTSNLHYMPSILSPLNYPVVDLLVFSLQS